VLAHPGQNRLKQGADEFRRTRDLAGDADPHDLAGHWERPWPWATIQGIRWRLRPLAVRIHHLPSACSPRPEKLPTSTPLSASCWASPTIARPPGRRSNCGACSKPLLKAISPAGRTWALPRGGSSSPVALLVPRGVHRCPPISGLLPPSGMLEPVHPENRGLQRAFGGSTAWDWGLVMLALGKPLACSVPNH